MSLEGRTLLVAGATHSSLGSAVCSSLIEHGASIVVVGTDASQLQDTLRPLRSTQWSRVVLSSLSDSESLQRLSEVASHVHGLVNVVDLAAAAPALLAHTVGRCLAERRVPGAMIVNVCGSGTDVESVAQTVPGPEEGGVRVATVRGADELVHALLGLTVDDFDLLATLGKGSYGKVLKVQHRASREVFALKAIAKRPNNEDNGATEQAILERTSHPFIVQLHGAFESDRFRFLLLDYLPGPTVLAALKETPGNRFEEQRAKELVAQVALALTHLHRDVGVIHRDVKADNVVLDGAGNAMLIDFGLSAIQENSTVNTSTCGTLAYLAPEVLKQSGGGYGPEVDWWSLGVVAYIMLTGCYPFLRPTPHETQQAILRMPLVFPSKLRGLSPEAASFVHRLLEKNPTRRMRSIEEMRRHPWMKGVDFERLVRRRPEMPTSVVLFTVFSPEVLGSEEHHSSDATMGYSGSGTLRSVFSQVS